MILATDLATRFPGPLPDGTRVGFHALPDARGVIVTGTSGGQRMVELDGTGARVLCENRDLFAESERGAQ